MSKIIQKIENLHAKVDSFKPLQKDQELALQERLRVEWTYNSNALEGNTLTFGETLFFLREGLTSEGRPLKDYLEAKNHAEAIEGLEEVLRGDRSLTESLIKEFHAVLMKGMEFSVAKGADGQMIQKPIHPGRYKLQPNHVLTLSGTIHRYTDPFHVPEEMEKLLSWYKSSQHLHPIERATTFHYRFVVIHPFDDGNGRIARILMNLILMKAGYPPCIIQTKHRRQYLQALEDADLGKGLSSLIDFIAVELLGTLEIILAVLEGREKPFEEQTVLHQAERERLVLDVLGKKEMSIGQFHRALPSIPRATLKSDLRRLVKRRKIRRRGRGRGVVYFPTNQKFA